jgi:hypothetical protein
VNGLAIVIFMSQLEFKTIVNGECLVIRQSMFIMLLGLVALTIAIVVFLLKQLCTISSHYCGFGWFRGWN